MDSTAVLVTLQGYEDFVRLSVEAVGELLIFEASVLRLHQTLARGWLLRWKMIKFTGWSRALNLPGELARAHNTRTGNDMKQPEYGNADATYQATGGQTGIRRLVDSFYDIMGNDPRYRSIYDMHPADKEMSRDRLALFLCGWMGGPRPFVEKYGPISIPNAHRHLKITEVERDLWLDCMARALALQDYPSTLVEYLQLQFYVPAERVRSVCMEQQ